MFFKPTNVFYYCFFFFYILIGLLIYKISFTYVISLTNNKSVKENYIFKKLILKLECYFKS